MGCQFYCWFAGTSDGFDKILLAMPKSLNVLYSISVLLEEQTESMGIDKLTKQTLQNRSLLQLGVKIQQGEKVDQTYS